MAKPAVKRSFKNSLGQTVTPPTFSATEAKNSFGVVMDAVASKGIVAITKRDDVRAVVLSVEEYEALAARVPDAIETLRSEFEALVHEMQSPSSKKAARALFEATPKELGRAAVKAARNG